MFALKLKELRQDKSLTQTELGEAIGLSKSAISAYEKNQRQPDNETLEMFAGYFGVSVDFLLGRSDDMIFEFTGKNLKTLRQGRTYEEYAVFLKEKTGINIAPELIEAYETGVKQIKPTFVEFIAKAENVDVKTIKGHTDTEKGKTGYDLSFMGNELMNFVTNPENKEYLDFLLDVYKAGIPKETLKHAKVIIDIKKDQ